MGQSMSIGDFSKEYYFKQISSNSWIQSMNISKDVIENISEFSIGVLRDCDADDCQYEVVMHHKEANLAELIPKNRNQRFSLPTDRIDNEYKDEMYFYDTKQDKAYCRECCIKNMSKCCKGSMHMICAGVIFENASKSYITCLNHRKLCLDTHQLCPNCNIGMCGSSCTNVVNKRDLCRPRKCGLCNRNGCPNCVPMISYKQCRKKNPPSYSGQVWKCHPKCK